MAAARSGPVLVVAEELDAAADMVVDQLNRREVPVMRFDAARFPQHLTFTGAHLGDAQWRGLVDDGRRTARLEEVRAVYYRRPGRPAIDPAVPEPYHTWAQNQADAALLNVLSALPVRWINDPHRDRLAAHKPQQLAVAARCGLTVPRTLITNDPDATRDFAKSLGGADVICKPVLGGRLRFADGDTLMVPTHTVAPEAMDQRITLTAHMFQEQILKAYEVRLTVVNGRMFAASLHATSDQARIDWRTDYDALTYNTVDVPDPVAGGVRRFLDHYGTVFGALDFAVTPAGEWVFFENNPAGTWSFIESETGLPISAAHADYLQGAPLS